MGKTTTKKTKEDDLTEQVSKPENTTKKPETSDTDGTEPTTPQAPETSDTDGTEPTTPQTPETSQTPAPSGAGETQSPTVNNDAIEALLIKLIEQELNNNNDVVKQLLLQRLAASNISYTRAPQPLNNTEIGGYYNLLNDAFGDDKTLSRQMLASILGIPYIG